MRRIIVFGLILAGFGLPAFGEDFRPSNSQVEGDYTEIIMIYKQMCREAPVLEYDTVPAQTRITKSNLIEFMSNPGDYAGRYRKDLDDHFVMMNGGMSVIESNAAKTAASSVQSEVQAMLDWNAKNHMVALKYSFCANSIAMYEIVSEFDCPGYDQSEFNFPAVFEFCADPYEY